MTGRLLLVVLFAAAAHPAPLDLVCARCHPAETKLHARTRMAHAMQPAPASDFVENLPAQALRESGDGFFFIYRRTENRVTVTSFLDDKRADGVLQWVLGAGAQGQTPLVAAGGQTLESRVSYFPQLHQYGITVGQDAGASANAPAALGRKLGQRDLETCINCHSTGYTGNLETLTPGVQCERCHPGAEEHAQGSGKRPFNPGKIAPPEQVRFCGNCHRVNPPVSDAELENLRFQPLRLMKSPCFQSGKLACTTCHPAHQDAQRGDPAFYNQKCHACHDAQSSHADDPRQTGDCIGCHMPYVQLHPALNFTDHFIRVVKAGDLPQSIVRRRPGAS